MGYSEALSHPCLRETWQVIFNIYTHLKNVNVVCCAVSHEHPRDPGLKRETASKY